MPRYETEAALCADFIEAAKADGWEVYPEQGSWDVLLVRRKVQVGVQAKLVANDEVLLQALPDDPRDATGPTYRAVLVGRYPGRTDAAVRRREVEFHALARHLRLLVLDPPVPGRRGFYANWLKVGFEANLALGANLRARYRLFRLRSPLDFWHYRREGKRVWTPPFVPEGIEAGVPSPRAVGKWQVASVRLEVAVRELGYASLDVARAIVRGVDGGFHAETLLKRWCVCTGERIEGTRQSRWVLRERGKRPTRAYPETAAGMLVAPK